MPQGHWIEIYEQYSWLCAYIKKVHLSVLALTLFFSVWCTIHD